MMYAIASLIDNSAQRAQYTIPSGPKKAAKIFCVETVQFNNYIAYFGEFGSND